MAAQNEGDEGIRTADAAQVSGGPDTGAARQTGNEALDLRAAEAEAEYERAEQYRTYRESIDAAFAGAGFEAWAEAADEVDPQLAQRLFEDAAERSKWSAPMADAFGAALRVAFAADVPPRSQRIL